MQKEIQDIEMTPESRVKAQVKKILTAYGAWYAMPVGGMLGRAGIPDFLVCLNGKFIAIETKAGRGKLTALQRLNLQQIKETGGIVLVINENNLSELKRVLYDASREEHSSLSREASAGCASEHPLAKGVDGQSIG